MIRALILTMVVLVSGMAAQVSAQDAGQRARDLTAALDKTKHKKKESKYVTVEVYVDIKNVPAVRNDPADYSGVYTHESGGFRLDLAVASNGTAEGKGYDEADGDNSARWIFTLKDARVQGAVLTAIKVYSNGTLENFEAVFADRTVSVGKNAENIHTSDVSFGIGFIRTGGNWQNRVFLERED